MFNTKSLEILKRGNLVLLDYHHANSCLFVDKHVISAIPTPEIEFLLESVGKIPEDYDAELVGYFSRFCSGEHYEGFGDGGSLELVSSVLVEPHVKGGHWNPFIRFNSSKISGGNQSRKWLDVVGVLNPDVKMNELVLTYPDEFDRVFFLHPELRDVFEKRMRRCELSFIDSLKEELGVSSGEDIGVSLSHHPWSTSNPVKPHNHTHGLFSHFVFKKVGVKRRMEIEQGLEFLYRDLCRCLSSDGEIVDDVVFQAIHREISDILKNKLGFRVLPWFGKHNTPLDDVRVKELWADAIQKEFADILTDEHQLCKSFDVRIKFFPVSDGGLLSHALSYKCRPPVVDLDAFFRVNGGVVVGYDAVDISKIRESDVRGWVSQFGGGCLIDWLKYLVVHKTNTSVYGFWRHLNRVSVTPMSVKVLHPHICPICGGSLSYSAVSLGFDVRVCSIIIKSGSHFSVFPIWDCLKGG